MIEFEDPRQMTEWSRARRVEGRRIGFVPTMGYLHEGHLRLIDRARELADSVVVSVFVNPLQFGPSEDFDRYPRDLERDRRAALRRGVDCLFSPSREAMYPSPPAMRIDPGALASHLCAPWRPGHFPGVLVVVAKLFHMVEPDVAIFGRKDAQQAVMVRRLARDLDYPVSIEVTPIVRASDGLALSSRNVYLNASERRAAPALCRALNAAHHAFGAGERDAAHLVRLVHDVVAAEPVLRPQYVEAVHAETLQPVERAEEDTLLAVAVYAGVTRLIDNVAAGVGTAEDIWLTKEP